MEGENRAAESEELKQQIEELKQQIEELPVGYISKKNIHNKTRYYRQWTENGKIKSQYIKEAQLDEIQDQIARRKELQQRLKDLEGERPEGKRQTAPRRRSPSSVKTKFQMNVIIGEGLRAMTDNICGEEKRSDYGKLMDYLDGEEDDRVCLVMGLRRTGKTTMIRQAILEMVSYDRQVAYIKATAADTMPVLSSDLTQLYRAGYRHVFVDEVTLMDDFIDSAALLSDIHAAQGMRIVLTGTDSLAFFFAMRQELYDRAVIIHTTFIPFREHSRVLGIHNMNDYIRYGGTMRAGEMAKSGTEIDSQYASFRDKNSTKEYVGSAVLRNIRRSIACSKDKNQFENLRLLQENGDLEEVVSRVIENMNLNFLLLVLSKDAVFHDLRLAAWNLRNDNRREEEAAGVKKVCILEVKEVLVALDLIMECPSETAQSGGEPIERVIFIQPGMRYCQLQELIFSLMDGERFLSVSEADKQRLADQALEKVREQMLEEIIFLETERALENYYKVYKLQFNAGDYDMVVYDTKDNTCTVCEIRGSESGQMGHYRRMPDAERYRQIERRFGRIREHFILCRNPENQRNDGKRYCSVEDYLRGLSMDISEKQ